MLADSVSAEHANITLLSLPGLEVRKLLGGYGARYLPTGHLLYGRGGDLYAVPFDTKSLRLVGDEKRVISNVAMQSLLGVIQAANSGNGLLAYASGGDAAIATFHWIDRQGNVEQISIEPGIYNYFDLSPDDRRLAIHVADVQDYVNIYEFEAGAAQKLPIDGHAAWPIWSPSGERLFLTQMIPEGFVLGSYAVDGSQAFKELIRSSSSDAQGSFWSSNGTMLFTEWGVGISVLSGGTDVVQSLNEDSTAWGAEASPDGRWIAYTSERTGLYEVRLRSFPKGDVDRQISTKGGLEPVWCRECDELFFRNGDRLYSSKIILEPELSIGPPRLVWEASGFVDTIGRSYDVSRDGQRLLFLRPVNEPTRTKLYLVHNWFAELERLVPHASGTN